MNIDTAFALPFDDDDAEAQDKETTPGGNEDVQWRVVAKTPGLANAHVLAGRLDAEEIPVYVWQEGAGQALGLTVGLLGIGYVMVPVEFVARAAAILAQPIDESMLDDEAMWDEEE